MPEPDYEDWGVNNENWDTAPSTNSCDPNNPDSACSQTNRASRNEPEPVPVDSGCGPNHPGPCWHSTGNLDPYAGGYETNTCPEPIAPDAPTTDTYGQLSGQVTVDWDSWRLNALRDVTYEV